MMPDSYYQLLCELIRMRSVSSDVAAVNRVEERFAEFLAANGVYCTMEQIDGRKVLYASTLPQGTPEILLNAHVDVVPAPDSQFEPVREGDWLVGRGAGDCLGNAVLMAKLLCETKGRASVGAVFTGDEEIGGATTKMMVEKGYLASKLILILDHWSPGYAVCTAEKGILSLKLAAEGRGGHASVPWRCDNPIPKLMEGLMRLAQNWRNPGENDQWHDSFAPTVLNAGSVHNQIPDRAEMVVNIRYTESGKRENLLEFVRSTTGLECSIIEDTPPVVKSEIVPIQQKLNDLLVECCGGSGEFCFMNGATDARWFSGRGIPIAILGIENSGLHSSAERASLASWKLLEKVLTRFLLENAPLN